MARKNGQYIPIKFQYIPLTSEQNQLFLASKGLEVQDDSELKRQYENQIKKPIMNCCENEFIDLDGFPVCETCGKVQTHFQELESNFNDKTCIGELLGMSNGYVYIAPRFYKPLSHFREHLRRYMGANTSKLPPEQLQYLKENLDETDKKAYAHLKELLKKINQPREYRNIWSILYTLGGKLPDLSNRQFHCCLNLFKKFMVVYDKEKYRWNRKSMPSHYMLLNEFLEVVGHEKYYEFPELKNSGLKKNVLFIINKCLSLYKNYVKQ